jgi:hypothetical protein
MEDGASKVCVVQALHQFCLLNSFTLILFVGVQRWKQDLCSQQNNGIGVSNSNNASYSLSTPRGVAVSLDLDNMIEVRFSPYGCGVGVGEAAAPTTTKGQ